ncbi:uncharacterized protein DAT39_001626, partial [Clarias magur]
MCAWFRMDMCRTTIYDIFPKQLVKNAMVSLVILVLVLVIFIEMYRCRMMICDKLCQICQGQ